MPFYDNNKDGILTDDHSVTTYIIQTLNTSNIVII